MLFGFYVGSSLLTKYDRMKDKPLYFFRRAYSDQQSYLLNLRNIWRLHHRIHSIRWKKGELYCFNHSIKCL